MIRDGNNKSFWQSTEKIEDFGTDFKELTFHTIVVGAGITGVTLAKELQNRGISCLLIDKKNPGFGTTGGTTAHINNFYDTSYDEIIANFGNDAGRELVVGTHKTLDYIVQNIRKYAVACEFDTCDFFLFSTNEKQTKKLDEIYRAHKQLGIKTVEDSSIPFDLSFEKVIKIEAQGQFHPIKYINGLLQAYKIEGGAFLLNQAIESFNNDGKNITIKTSDARIFTAKNLVWATHVPPGKNRFNLLLTAYRSYVMVFKLTDPPTALAQAADLYDPYHYFRYHVSSNGNYLIAGGFDHKTGVGENSEKCFTELDNYVRRYLGFSDFVAKWSSQYYVSADGLPYIGRMPSEKNIYVSTGYGGNGMTFGTMASLVIPDLLEGKENELSKMLSPGRIKPIVSVKSVLSVGINASKHLIKDKLGAKQVEIFGTIPLNEGRIVTFENKNLAVFRDKDGGYRALNASCTHMGCTVTWNPSEQSWDCPCHGSRFDIEGNVLNGPAITNLKREEYF